MLLEREPELRAIEAALDRLADGRGSLLLVEGPAGIGKTSLLAEARALPRGRDLLVRAARGGEIERDLPFGVVRELFEPVIDASTEEARSHLLAGSAGLARFALGTEPEARPMRAVDAAAPIHGLYWFLSNLSEMRPVVLAIDDAHWADPQTLRFLEYLGRRIADVPVLVLAAIRTGEPDHPPELKPLRMGAEVLELRPLSPSAVADVIRKQLGGRPDRDFVESCAEATAGNPFLIVEVLRSIREEAIERGADPAAAIASLGPQRVAQQTLLRLERFGQGAVALAKAIAVLGGSPLLRDVARLAGLDTTNARTLTDRLRDAEILAPGQPIEFVHPLVRQAIYRDLSDGTRSEFHRRAAEILSESGVSARDVAPHLLACAPNGDAWVLARLREAARQAMADGAYEAARSYMDRALREPSDDRATDLFLLGRSTYEINPTMAPAILDAAAEAATDRAQRIEALRWSANACIYIGNFPDVVRKVEEALRLLPAGEREQALCLEAQANLFSYITEGRTDALARRLRNLAEGLEGRTSGERVARQALSVELFHACEPVEEVIDAASRFPPPPWEIAGFRDPVPMAAAKVLSWCGRWEQAASEIQAYAEAGQRRGYLNVAIAGHGALAEVWRLAGRLADAEAEAQTALEIAGAIGTFTMVSMGARMALLATLLERGEVERAAELAEELPMWLGPREFYLPPWPAELRGYLRLAQGDLAGGIESLLELHDATEALGTVNPAISSWRQEAAPVLVALGRSAEAEELIRVAEERARSFGAPHVIGEVLRARAALEPRKRQLDTLQESVRALEVYGPPQVLARSLIEVGAALRRDGQRSAARDPLRRALDLAHRSSAGGLEQRARDELAASGARPRQPVLTGPASLTASELRTAKLAAEGLTNKEIAQRLFVSLRTVETHLTHAYDKLQIRGRDELEGALAEPG